MKSLRGRLLRPLVEMLSRRLLRSLTKLILSFLWDCGLHVKTVACYVTHEGSILSREFLSCEWDVYVTQLLRASCNSSFEFKISYFEKSKRKRKRKTIFFSENMSSSTSSYKTILPNIVMSLE
jgi:hypothetical protein